MLKTFINLLPPLQDSKYKINFKLLSLESVNYFVYDEPYTKEPSQLFLKR